MISLREFRAGPGAALCAALKERGLPKHRDDEPDGKREWNRGLLAHADDLPEHRFGIAVLHIMNAGSSKATKVRFWDAFLQAAESRQRKPFLFVGDWNTGAHRLDETGKTFVCAEQFCRLSTMGWTDMWRHHNPGITEWTWYSKLKGGVHGNGFRLDHAFTTPSLKPRLTSCR